jgi:hypothetical protein
MPTANTVQVSPFYPRLFPATIFSASTTNCSCSCGARQLFIVVTHPMAVLFSIAIIARAFGLDGSPVKFHQVTDDRQPEAQPAVRALHGRLRLDEAFEHARQKRRSDPDPAVADAHLEL